LDGHRVWTVDLAIDPRVTHTSVPDSDYSSDNYGAAVNQLPPGIDGRLALARMSFLRRPEEAAMPEVQAGTAELRRKFRVRSSSRPLAQRILDDRVCEWLTGPGRRFHYELVHERGLAYGWRPWPRTQRALGDLRGGVFWIQASLPRELRGQIGDNQRARAREQVGTRQFRASSRAEIGAVEAPHVDQALHERRPRERQLTSLRAEATEADPRPSVTGPRASRPRNRAQNRVLSPC
jgi:hypothetical protein